MKNIVLDMKILHENAAKHSDEPVTSGITEALSGAGEMFTDKRLIEALSDDTVQAADVLVDTLNRKVDDFCKGADQFDDITVVAVSFK